MPIAQSIKDRVSRIKSGVPIERLIGMKFEVRGTSTREHSSLTIYPKSNTFYWFKQGYGGDHFDWLKHQHGMGFNEALQYLENMYLGIPQDIIHTVSERIADDKCEHAEQAPLSNGLNEEYKKNLKNSNELLEKLFDERGINSDVADRYSLGYCNNHWHRGPSWTIPTFGKDNELLTIRHRQWTAGIGDPRYLPERTGDGIHLFNSSMVDDETLLVEGEFKAIVCSETIMPTCAVSGCQSFKKEWIDEFCRRCKKCYIALDPDIKISNPFDPSKNNPHGMSWIKNLIEYGCDCRRVNLPDKPDDLIRKGGANLVVRAIKTAMPIRIKE